MFEIDLADYVKNNPKEEQDYMNWCEENSLYPLIITAKHLGHIYAKALYFLYISGYDVAGFEFKVIGAEHAK